MTYVSGIINIFILKIYIRIEFRDNNYIREKSTKLETVCGDVSCNKVAPETYNHLGFISALSRFRKIVYIINLYWNCIEEEKNNFCKRKNEIGKVNLHDFLLLLTLQYRIFGVDGLKLLKSYFCKSITILFIKLHINKLHLVHSISI